MSDEEEHCNFFFFSFLGRRKALPAWRLQCG